MGYNEQSEEDYNNNMGVIPTKRHKNGKLVKRVALVFVLYRFCENIEKYNLSF